MTSSKETIKVVEQKEQQTSSFNREEILKRTMELLLLSSGFITTPQVANFFGITLKELNKTVKRHKGELLENGYVDNIGNGYFSRRAILLLLGNNKIAEEVRTQIVNIEGNSSKEDKLRECNIESALISTVIEAMSSEDTKELEQANSNLETYMRNKYAVELPEVANLRVVK